MMPSRLLVTVAIAGLVVLAARVASADDTALADARLHFERGEKLYALTRFSEAIDEYQKAFDGKPLPDFLFNIGQCYRNLGDYDAAIFSYRKYLKLAPDAPNREQVEQLIGELEVRRDRSDTGRLGLRRTDDRPPPVRADDRESERPLYKQWWFWTGVAVLGVVTYAVTRSSDPPSTSLGNIVFGR